MIQNITILGSTGSIGVSTLDVIRRHPERFRVTALCAHTQIDRLFDQCLEFRPRYALVRDAELAVQLRQRLSATAASSTEVEYGAKALVAMAALPEVDTVMAAIVGAAGLEATFAAALAGKKILLANKEALVMAGSVFMRAVAENSAVLLPIDSEHNAIFQSLPETYSGDFARSGVSHLWLTASGGPFRSSSLSAMSTVTPEQACAHPNWVMGKKISVDCATMMNKGLEVIEAHWLFHVPADKIQVVIHPQSVIHSLVQYIDGSVIAELGNPDMRTPIAQALAYPQRIAAGVAPLDLFSLAALDFERPDVERFPCLRLAYQALHQGGSKSASLNAANEVAVHAFLERKLGFAAISKLIEKVVDSLPAEPLSSLSDVLAADSVARQMAEGFVLNGTFDG
ncbi:MAG: 1-deoxy-D-xylulose-5-phosphate reductoisomerase [Pseudomonadota bacterium]